MTVYKKPITLSDIKKITGIGAKQLGYMITNGAKNGTININSLHKPVRVNSFAPITEEQRKAVNYGFGIITYNSYNQMVQGYNNGEAWGYEAPRGINFETSTNEPPEQFRMQDFDGYDDKATSPFEIRTESEPRIGENLRLIFPTAPIDLVSWGMWSGYQGANLSALQLGIYVPSVGYYPITYGGFQIDDIDYDYEKGLSVPITSAFTKGQTYKAFLVLTTWDVATQRWYQPSPNENDSGNYWWLFNAQGTTPFEFTVQGEYNAMESIGGGSMTGVTIYAPNAIAQDRYINTSFDYEITNDGYAQGNPYIDIRFVVPRVWSGYETIVSDKEIGKFTKYNFTEKVTATAHINYPDELMFLASKDEGLLRIEARIRLVQPSVNAGGKLVGQRIEYFEIYATNI